MSNVIYQSKINQIGEFAPDALADGMLILFKNGAPSDLADYCFVHSHDDLKQDLQVGQVFQIGKHTFQITSVGDVASTNFRELGHITLRFDGSSQAELPGTIHVKGDIPNQLFVGDEIKILTN
ncbi:MULTISPECIES: PTS glucitol/sorbitol transporter subunit IIA [unclassified Gilliamella]|uniref:PTS glucitol/sorbitol transporter subunit IIA n=1 Tax=unclassified Gilliamella TaxID=2685620 RepID=UPI00080E72AB|nr:MULTISPECIES: PTS glucitol/sorbitol transporter subunit IIA [Gilliamella]MCX8582914.1 PTS glucitol/sorbitol transporter subunit IIA [Gilliamella sp. B3372]MCX8595437.1 PTS glucitol/sorbitol transporter subunit IIA [Gilliamella sp. B3367]OCG00080.1 PTS glucitol/sorbitol transporter subunit IIA [Gilliamella apicola]OCL18803.1 PTS glucitol/sorbitol transporter subunit IIA [Gilliamella apicola]QYN41378.1 PTS glucitol/sorbitol transporter subunit IIA [Gilliamella sp. ESL0443]